MLSKDIEVVDLGGENQGRLFGLLASALRGDRRTDTLLVFFRGSRVLKAVDIDSLAPVSIEFAGTSRLGLLAARYGYRRVVALEETALSRIVGHAQREVAYSEGYLKQWYAFARGLAREWKRTVFTYPEGPARLPLVPYPVLAATLRSLLPRDSIGLLVVTERDRAWASLAFGFRHGEVWLLTSLEAVGLEDEEMSEAALRAAAGALSERYGGRVRAVVVERRAIERTFESEHPAASLLRAHATGELRLLRFPLRWKAFWMAAALAAGRARRK